MFERIVGNLPSKQLLERLSSHDRIPGSMLFAGPIGVGKFLFALEIARLAICTNASKGSSCGECSACLRAGEITFPKDDARDDHKRVFFSNHPDVAVVIPYNRQILVDAVRNLEAESQYRPFEGRGRTFIVDDADKMNDAASNALLKTLEEPPATTRIILISSRPDSLLPTIRSRCQTVRFGQLSIANIRDHLVRKKALSEHEATVIAGLSGGSIGNAEKINVREFFEHRERMLAVVSDVLETGDFQSLIRVSEEMNDAKNKERFEDNLAILESLIRDVWLIRQSGFDRLVNKDLEDRLTQLAAARRSIDLASWLTRIEELRENLAVNLNRRLATDALFASMAA